MKEIIHCPFCSSRIFNFFTKSPENGGDIYVAEDCENSTEVYDDIKLVKCDNGHSFYVSKED
jgi:hypothetical protein